MTENMPSTGFKQRKRTNLSGKMNTAEILGFIEVAICWSVNIFVLGGQFDILERRRVLTACDMDRGRRGRWAKGAGAGGGRTGRGK
jgi:hypothetical protein